MSGCDQSDDRSDQMNRKFLNERASPFEFSLWCLWSPLIRPLAIGSVTIDPTDAPPRIHARGIYRSIRARALILIIEISIEYESYTSDMFFPHNAHNGY